MSIDTIPFKETQAVRREYDGLALDYDRRWRQYTQATLSTLLEPIQLAGDEIILDVPCGTGALARLLLSHFPELKVTGVDISLTMLQVARTRAAGPNVRWIQADVAALPLADHTFDLVLCANGFHYFRRPLATLTEFFRVLRPGGRLVLVDWCHDYFACKAFSLWLRWTERAFYQTYSLRSCESLLRQSGFEAIGGTRFRVGWLWGLMRLTCCRNGQITRIKTLTR